MTLTVDKDSETRRTYRPAHNGRDLANFGLTRFVVLSFDRSFMRESTEYSGDSRATWTTLSGNGNEKKNISFVELEPLIFSYANVLNIM